MNGLRKEAIMSSCLIQSLLTKLAFTCLYYYGVRHAADAVDNHNYMCHTCAKGYLDSNFNEAIINNISNFHEIAPNFIYSQKSFFFFFFFK